MLLTEGQMSDHKGARLMLDAVGSHLGVIISNFGPKKAVECENIDQKYSHI